MEQAAATAQTEAPRLKLVLNMRLSSIDAAHTTPRQWMSTGRLLYLSLWQTMRV